jgi:cytochrome oxidase Cu insertion factor (SCO1/SenC/PrrC family)
MIRWVVHHPLLATLTPLAAFLACAGLLLAVQSARQFQVGPAGGKHFAAEGPDDFGPVGDFAFTERSGKTVTPAGLRGKVWVAACFFTCCTESCPQLSASMTRLQHELAGEPDVRLVSLTVDPAHDTPAVLNRYAETYSADGDRWLFLTGSPTEVTAFVRDRLHLGVEANMDPGTAPGSRVLHSPKLTLIDRRGRIRGYFDGTDPAAVGRLRDAAVRLAREAP